ncbi:MAG: CopD family protein, partial [Propionibacteriaceae bacterium]
ARPHTRGASWVALGAAALALSAPVWVGHTQTMVPRWLGVLADLAHLAAASVWAGGLLGLAVLLRLSRPGSPTREGTTSGWVDPERLTGIVVRFSAAALGSVLVLLVSGATMAVLILPTWSSLLGTGYGRTLLVKVGVVVAVVALAAWNRFRLVPAVRAQPSEVDRWLRLRAILGREFALVLAVVAITGFLSTSSPVHDHSADGGREEVVQLAAESQGLSVDGTVAPATPGTNTLDFTLAHHGHTVDGAEVTVRARLPEQGLGPIEVVPERDPATGRYRAELTLPAAGEWRVEIAARTSTYDQPIVVVPVSVR